MIAHVVCCNDAVEAVALGTKERALKILGDLRDADMLRVQQDGGSIRELYQKEFYWRLETVRVYK